MLLKASGSVPHTGGVLSRPGEPYYELLRAWIAGGVKFDQNGPRPTALEVFPKDVTIPLPGMKQQLAVTAALSDGSVRDVSSEAFVETSNIEVLSVDKRGLATAVRRGEAAVLVRYEGNYAVATVTVMGDRSGFAWKDVPTNNYIDELVYAKLKKLRVEPSGLATDAEFLRRVYLDLTGLPPKPEEVRALLADGRDTRVKRDEVIDRLIGSPAFLEHWTNKWADLLQVNPKMTSPEVAAATRKWIRQALADNLPYDKFAPYDSHGQRIDRRQPGGLLLRGGPHAGDGFRDLDATVPRRAVQLQQVPRPSLRALDPEPVLPACGLFLPDRP